MASISKNKSATQSFGHSWAQFVYDTWLYVFPTEYKEFRKPCHMIAFTFSAFFVLGFSFYLYADWSMVFGSLSNFLRSTIVFLVCAVVTDVFVGLIYRFINRFQPRLRAERKLSWFTNNRKSFLVVTGLILICWLPYMIALFPGNCNLDTNDQIYQILGMREKMWTLDSVILLDDNVITHNYHPIFLTWVIKFFLKLGLLLGNSLTLGIALMSFTQCICIAAVFSFTIWYMARIGISRKFRIVTFCFFAFFPLIPIYAMTILKDSVYAPLTLLVAIGFLEIGRDTYGFLHDKRKCLALAFFMFLSMLVRNNGSYVFIVAAPIMIFIFRKEWKRMALLMLIPLFIFTKIYSGMLLPALNIASGPKREALSIPIQQIARLVKYHSDDLSEHDKEVISKVLCSGGSVEALGNRYDPEKSDNAKNFVDKYATTEDYIELFKVWGKHLFTHFGTYVEATLNNCYGYFFPGGSRLNYYWRFTKNSYGIQNYKPFDDARNFLCNLPNEMNQTPILFIFTNVTTYIWTMIICFVYLIVKKKFQYMPPFIIGTVLLLTCIASPVNGLLRYVYALFLCAPLFIAVIYMSVKQDRIQEASQKVRV